MRKPMRLIETITEGKNVVKVYYEYHLLEYCVKLYVAGKYRKNADSFTDDRDDALSTARVMAKEGK
jgi:hypothetical protein